MANVEKPAKTKNERIREVTLLARQIDCSLTENKSSARFIKSMKLQIATLLDVGVHSGTPYLYEAFADKRIVCFDPSPTSQEKIKAKHPELLRDFNLVALGHEPGTVRLNLVEGGSSLLDSSGRAYSEDPRYAGTMEVQVERLDDVVARQGYQGPFGLKVDVEGYELNVLKGASATLRDCVFVIAEVSVRRRFKDSYHISELIGFLAEHGFELLSMLNEKPGLQPFYDCLFLKRTHRLITNEKKETAPKPAAAPKPDQPAAA